MEESFRSAVCTRVVYLASALRGEKLTKPSPPRTIPVLQRETMILPQEVRKIPFEMLLLGILVGIWVAIVIAHAFKTNNTY